MNYRVPLFGFEFMNLPSEADLIAHLKNFSSSSNIGLPVVCTPNAAQIVAFSQNEELRDFFQKSAFVLPDGQPIVWLSRLVGNPLQARLTGSSLFPLVWKEAIASQKRTMLLVSDSQVAEYLQNENRGTFIMVAPNLNSHSKLEGWMKEVNEQIMKIKPDWVFIGLGFPKQELICRYCLMKSESNSKPLFFLLGASFEFYCGLKKRAPKVWQKLGLEWLFRFIQEPIRLFKRYTIVNFQFILLAWKEWRKEG